MSTKEKYDFSCEHALSGHFELKKWERIQNIL